MKKELNKGNQSHYDIKLTIDPQEYNKLQEKMIKKFAQDLKVSGFRKWHVPKEIVTQHINPEHLQIGIYEEAINMGIKDILKENKDIRFIGEPYGFDQTTNKDDKIYSFKIDIYPEVIIKNDDRKKEKITELKVKVNKDEVNHALINLKKNYAEYIDTDTIAPDTVSKVKLEFLDKNWEVKDTGYIYVGEPEFQESDFYTKTFIKKWKEAFELEYKEKSLPATMHFQAPKDSDLISKNIKKIRLTISDIKKIVLPEMTENKIQQLFGKDSKIKNEKELKIYIEDTLMENAQEKELIKTIESYVQKIRNKSLIITIPQTLIEEEFKTRTKNLEQKFGSKEKVEQYLTQLWEKKAKLFLEEIKQAANESLEKFFILQQLCELHKLDINRTKPLSGLIIEKKLYTKLTWKSLEKKPTTTTKIKKETKKETTKKKTQKK